MKIHTNLCPGMAGIIGVKDPAVGSQAVDVMLRRMNYGDRATAGRYRNRKLGLDIGWVLPAERQGPDCPIWSPDKKIGLIILGEIYEENPRIIDKDSESVEAERGKNLIRNYEKEGIRCLEKLNGWFGGLLIDLREQRVFLFNDRYGLFRVHYHENSNGFHFSSEAKSILAAVPETRQLDLKSLGEFLSCGCVLQDRSIFSGISLLPGGSAWTFQPLRRPHPVCYFDKATWEDQDALGLPEYYERLKETWIRILPKYFAGQRIGLSLTGGVDSRMILAWAPGAAGRLSCYTFAGKYRESMDLKVARQIAGLCGCAHETIYVDHDFLSAFPDFAESSVFLSDGTMDVTGSIDLYVQTVARQIAPIRITGTNGGEILRSLVAFKPGNVSPAPFSLELGSCLQAAAITYSKELCSNKLSFTAFKQVPWYMNTKFSLERSQIVLRMPYFDNELVSLAYRAPKNGLQDNDLSLRLTADGNPALAGIGTDRGLGFGAKPVLERARHLYQQFTFKLEYAYDYGMPNWLAKLDRLCSPLHLENLVLGRHKFHHFRVWYRDELSSYLKNVLLDIRTMKRPYLRGPVIEKMVKEHLAGTRNHTREFHKIITSELIQRQFIEQRQGP